MTKLIPIHEPSIAYHAPAGAFNHGSMTPVRVVLHDTECHDAAGITEIEGVVHFWMQTSANNRLGSHYIVDGDGNIGKLADGTHLLYHVGGLNTGSIGIEQIGFASFTETDWLARPGQLTKVAKLLAYLHHEYGIPLEVPSPQGATQANHGVMTHAMVSRFESASEGHTDPGSGYPLGRVLAMAQGYVKAGGWAPPGADPNPLPPPTPKRPKKAHIHYTTKKQTHEIVETAHPHRWMIAHAHVWWNGPVSIIPVKK